VGRATYAALVIAAAVATAADAAPNAGFDMVRLATSTLPAVSKNKRAGGVLRSSWSTTRSATSVRIALGCVTAI
jgi:hypothetical protein